MTSPTTTEVGRTPPDLEELAARVESGSGADRRLDYEVFTIFAARDRSNFWDPKVGHHYTTSLDAVVALMREILPGFWWRGGTCFLSSEAIIAPDHNCPVHGERLLREFPPTVEHWNAGIEVEIRPGGDEALVRALLSCLLRAAALRAMKEEGR